MRPDLRTLLPARTGHFALESGHHGTVWLDLDRLFLRPDRLRPLAAELAAALASHGAAAVCGPLTGGAFLAQMVADVLGVEFCFTERAAPFSYRLPPGLRDAVRGKAVAVVDDAINAGSAVRGTVAELEGCGATVAAVGALLVLGPVAPAYFAERNVPLERLADLPGDLWEPAACPLCAAGMPLDRPVPARTGGIPGL